MPSVYVYIIALILILSVSAMAIFAIYGFKKGLMILLVAFSTAALLYISVLLVAYSLSID